MCSVSLFRSSCARTPWPLLAVVVIVILHPWAGAAEKTSAGKPAEAAIRATADAFVKAFQRGDAKAVAALWTVSGSLADDRGELFTGRKAIEEQYAAFFKRYPGAKLEIAIKSIDFPTPALAVEDGIGQVLTPQAAPPVASRYTAVHVLENGKWLMASVRETGMPLSSTFSRLQDLGWLIGEWETTRDGTSVHSSFRWIANHSFLERQYTVRQDGLTTLSGIQIIGWDPQAGQVRSWSFDSSGGHGTGLWTASPDGWRIESTGALSDGTLTSSRDFLIRVAGEENVLGWRSSDRKAGAMTLPDTPEVVLDRLSAKR